MLRVGPERDERSVLLGDDAGDDDVAVDAQRLTAAIYADRIVPEDDHTDPYPVDAGS